MAPPGEVMGQRSETVRRANLSAIVRDLHLRGTRSRSELGARSGLTRTGIRGLVTELAAVGLVSEPRPAPRGGPGRPSALVQPDPEAAVVLALEIAVDSLAVAVVGFGGTVHHLLRIDRPRERVPVDETVADLAGLARLARASIPDGAALIGIGVAVVGITRRLDGLVELAPNLGWQSVPLGSRLAEAVGLSAPIAVANEAVLGALAEHRRGAALGARHVLFVSGEVGVGGGIIADGRSLTGAGGYGGEIGHIPVNPAGVACHCGSLGCWETEVAEGALLRRAGRSPHGGRTAVEEVLRDAASGEPTSLAALDEVGRWLGFGLAGLINVLDPELVILGGLFGRIYPYVTGTMFPELERRALPASRRVATVLAARLGVDAPLLGAAELAFEPLLADPVSCLLARRKPLPSPSEARAPGARAQDVTELPQTQVVDGQPDPRPDDIGAEAELVRR